MQSLQSGEAAPAQDQGMPIRLDIACATYTTPAGGQIAASLINPYHSPDANKPYLPK